MLIDSSISSSSNRKDVQEEVHHHKNMKEGLNEAAYVWIWARSVFRTVSRAQGGVCLKVAASQARLVASYLLLRNIRLGVTRVD